MIADPENRERVLERALSDAVKEMKLARGYIAGYPMQTDGAVLVLKAAIEKAEKRLPKEAAASEVGEKIDYLPTTNHPTIF